MESFNNFVKHEMYQYICMALCCLDKNNNLIIRSASYFNTPGIFNYYAAMASPDDSRWKDKWFDKLACPKSKYSLNPMPGSYLYNRELCEKVCKFNKESLDVTKEYIDNIGIIEDELEVSLRAKRIEVIEKYKKVLLSKLEKENATQKR